MFSFFDKFIDDVIKSDDSIYRKMMKTRLISSVVIIISAILSWCEVNISSSLKFNLNIDKLMCYYPTFGFGVFFFIVIPLLMALGLGVIRGIYGYKSRNNLKRYYIADCLTELAYTVFYCFIAVLYVLRYCYRILSFERENNPDGLILVLAFIHIGIFLFSRIKNVSAKSAAKIIKDDIDTPFSDINGKPLHIGDHMYCNGLEYKLCRDIIDIKGDNQLPKTKFKWYLTPVINSDKYPVKDLDMLDIRNKSYYVIHAKEDERNKNK